MSQRNQYLYVQDILDSIHNIKVYTKHLTREKFFRNRLVIDAVVRNFEIIGEAAKNVSSETRNKHSDIPWKEMSGMRNKMIHEYFGVDLEIVWETIEEALPELEKKIKKLRNK